MTRSSAEADRADAPAPAERLSGRLLALARAASRLAERDGDAPMLDAEPVGPHEPVREQLRAATVAAEAAALSAEASASDLEPLRRAFLAGHLRAVAAVASALAGAETPAERVVADLTGLPAARCEGATLVARDAALADALPGRGDVVERAEAWRRAARLPVGRPALWNELVLVTLAELRRRAAATVELPPPDVVEVALVRGPRPLARTRRLGDGRARLEVGIEAPATVVDLVRELARETWPGRATARWAVDRRLRVEAGWPEAGVLFSASPLAALVEGAASLALDAVMPPAEAARFAGAEVAARAGIGTGGADLEAMFRAASLVDALDARGDCATTLLEGSSEPTAGLRLASVACTAPSDAAAVVLSMRPVAQRLAACAAAAGRAALAPLVRRDGAAALAALLRVGLEPSAVATLCAASERSPRATVPRGSGGAASRAR
ncbi:MAG: hypothetical protein IT460_10070 [Planctomycetes bacterium]|nr:hypothetical protein [Planctomycetota bacterium]